MGERSTVEVVSRADRNRMADDLNALGLYAMANDVRKGRAPLTKGVAHVRDDCLPPIERGIEQVRQRNENSPPAPGTLGASVLSNCEARRDALARFVRDWILYDFAGGRS